MGLPLVAFPLPSRSGFPAQASRQPGAPTLRALTTQGGPMDEVAALDAIAQAELVRTGAASPSELLDAALARIERLNPELNAVIHRLDERAREQVAAGLADGPFRGVPFLLKDFAAEYEGTPFNEGSNFPGDHVSTVNQELTDRFLAAGLVVCGKTNTPEFGILPTTEPRRHGATRNPWDTSRTTGGSSGGSAAAVASGMVPLAHANDGGGSIRIPAACCGLVGLKPTGAGCPSGRPSPRRSPPGPVALPAAKARSRRSGRVWPRWSPCASSSLDATRRSSWPRAWRAGSARSSTRRSPARSSPPR